MPKRDGVFERKDCAGWYASYVDAKGVRRKKRIAATSRTQAMSALSLIKAKVQVQALTGVKEIPDTSTDDLRKRYEKYQKGRIAPETMDRTKAILKAMVKRLPEQLKAIDRAAIAALVGERFKAVAAATVQKEMTILKHMFRLAVEWDLMASNPAERVKLPTVTESRTRYLSPAELKAVLVAAPEWMRAPIALAAFTGMRRGELLGLKWTDIDGNRAYIRETKNESMRVVALNKLALQIIDSLPRTHPLLFPNVEAHRLTMETRRLFKRLDIADASFHTLRHTAASLMVMAGADLYAAGQQLGHKTPRMTSRYAHLSPTYMTKTAGTLDSALKGVLDGRDSHGTNEPQKPSESFLTYLPKKVDETPIDIGDNDEIANDGAWLN